MRKIFFLAVLIAAFTIQSKADTAHFTVPDTVCSIYATVVFTNTSTYSDTDYLYLWVMPTDCNISFDYTGYNMLWVGFYDTGMHTAWLYIYSNATNLAVDSFSANFYVLASPQPTFIVDSCILSVVNVDAGATYQWCMTPLQPFATTSITGATGYMYHAVDSGYYDLIETASNGCTWKTGKQHVNICLSDTATLIPTVPKERYVLYPNPATNQFTVEFPGRFTVLLYDMFGRKIKSESGVDMVTISLSDMPAGVYVAKTILTTGEMLEARTVRKL